MAIADSVAEDESEESFYDLVEFKDDDDFLIIDNTKKLTAIRSAGVRAGAAGVETEGSSSSATAMERSLACILKSIEESTERLSSRLDALEKLSARRSGGIFISWGQLVLLLGWPVLLLGFYIWWRKRVAVTTLAKTLTNTN